MGLKVRVSSQAGWGALAWGIVFSVVVFFFSLEGLGRSSLLGDFEASWSIYACVLNGRDVGCCLSVVIVVMLIQPYVFYGHGDGLLRALLPMRHR